MDKQQEVIDFILAIKPYVKERIKWHRLTSNRHHFFLQFGDDPKRTLHLLWSHHAGRWEVIYNFKGYILNPESVPMVDALSELATKLIEELNNE